MIGMLSVLSLKDTVVAFLYFMTQAEKDELNKAGIFINTEPLRVVDYHKRLRPP